MHSECSGCELILFADVDHPQFHQETRQRSSRLWGSQKALTFGRRPSPHLLPEIGIVAVVRDSHLRRRGLLANGTRISYYVEFLAQGPEVDNTLFRVHTDRHPGHGSLPSPARPPAIIQQETSRPKSAWLLSGDQPSSHTPSWVGPNVVTVPQPTRSPPPPGKQRRQPPPPTMDAPETPIQQQCPPAC